MNKTQAIFKKNKFQIPIDEGRKSHNLEERTFDFARGCRLFLKELNRTNSNIEDFKQLVKSSRSVGANYIEANEKLGDKDFLIRLEKSRKEAKESKY